MPAPRRVKRSAATQHSPQTEQTAVEAPPEFQELIFIVQSATGQVVKIDKLENGQRQELTEEEYAAVAAPFATTSGYADATAYQLAYYQGMADYAAALWASYASPTEQAYYQALADYASTLRSTG
jgi:hypothetical protein